LKASLVTRTACTLCSSASASTTRCNADFGTPGLVMRALAMVHEDVPATPQAVREALSGNLRRCTGYEGIVHAVCEGLLRLRPSA